MKLAIAILAVYFTIINGGIVKRESKRDTPLSCYDGSDSKNDAIKCISEEQVCQTTIFVNNEKMQIEKTCKEENACGGNEMQNRLNCIGSEAMYNKVQICQFCCDDDLCNLSNNLTEYLEQRGMLVDYAEEDEDDEDDEGEDDKEEEKDDDKE